MYLARAHTKRLQWILCADSWRIWRIAFAAFAAFAACVVLSRVELGGTLLQPRGSRLASFYTKIAPFTFYLNKKNTYRYMGTCS